ncbi:MAG: protein kinase [Myxococcota bacterium]|nr:protein kinase [Myxococcota bacterium]
MRSPRNLHFWIALVAALLGLAGDALAQSTSGEASADREAAAAAEAPEAASFPQWRPGPDQLATPVQDTGWTWPGNLGETLAAGLPYADWRAAGLLAALVALFFLLRGRGDLRVALDYPAELRGTFRVRIARKPSSEAEGADAARGAEEASAARKSTRTEHPLVSRETGFFGVRSGTWHVTVDGFLKLPGDDAIVATHFEERKVRVGRGRTLRLDVDVSEPHGELGSDTPPLEAARLALANGATGRALQDLQRLAPDDTDYTAAVKLLVEVLQREGQIDLAVERMEDLVRNCGVNAAPLPACEQLADLLEENEQCERALVLLQSVRRHAQAGPELNGRIEKLRKQLKLEGGEAPKTDTDSVRYELLEEIGRGGMGIVFRTRDRRLNRVVALKKLPEKLRKHPKAVELFLREARTSAQLNHPNIVTVHDTGQQGNALYITMELMEGLPLHALLKQRGALSPREVAKLGLHACAGLRYAHDHRVTHRDIKTANFFFTKSRTLKIMDFGLANMVQAVRPSSTVVGGTPYYMAPEQSLGGEIDHRTDLYALGVTFYELLTGAVPFPDGDIAFHHRHTPAPDPRATNDEVPETLAELVQWLMAKDPADRPQSAGEVHQRLQEFLAKTA